MQIRDLIISILVFLFIPLLASAEVISRLCPYNCKSAGYSKSVCSDWRVADKCFIELRNKSPQRSILCKKISDGSLRVRTKCKTDGTEELLNIDSLKGDPGEQGPSGENGFIKIYGDGSRGNRTILVNETFNDSNPQYENFTIEAGVTVTIPSGIILRCTGEFRNKGTIIISNGLDDSPRFGDNGRIAGSASSSPLESAGGRGGAALPNGVAKQIVRLSLLAGGKGYQEKADSSGGEGGGNFTVLTKDSIFNEGNIRSNGNNATQSYRGGGAGGFILLASLSSIFNSGTIEAKGGDGGPLLSVDANNTGYGPGGGGGGGIVHFISPQNSNTGNVNISGGTGATGGGINSITGLIYLGGGGGGGAGGKGGDGGIINLGNSGDGSSTDAENGEQGIFIQTTTDPSTLF